MVAAAMRDIPLLGCLPRQAEVLPERHLGLVLPEEVGQIDAMLDTMAEQLDLDMQAWDALPETQFALAAPVAIPRLLEGKNCGCP
jgi:cobyrinic acid a,c-diamide synthase